MRILNEQTGRDMSRRSFLQSCLAAATALPLSAVLAELGMSGPAEKPLPKRRLGRTGVMVCALGLGGAWWMSETRDKDSVETILQEALAAGITFFDTYPGRCQENLGMITGTRHRKRLFIASKVKKRTYDGAMREFDGHLKELRVDSIDLLQIHHIDKDEDLSALKKPDGAIAALRSLRDQKAIRFLGITGHPEFERVKECLESCDDFDTFMGFINPSKRAKPSLEEQMPVARRKNMGIIAMKVYGGRDPANLVGNGPNQASAGELLRFALSEDIAVAIPAVSSVAQLRENIAIARSFTPMPNAEREALIARVWNNPCCLHDR